MTDNLLAQLCVPEAATIEQTMRAIDAGSAEIALVVADNGRLLATVSDGDIRRALLRGATLGDPVIEHANRSFTSVTTGAGRAEVLDLMQARLISQVPELDAGGRVVALHLMQQLVGADALPNVAVVMAGGRGVRLRPLTEHLPKPMLRVAGRPILERLVLHLVGNGVRQIFLAVNYLREVVEEHFGDGAQFGCRIDYLRESPDKPLGTAGALRLLPPEVASGEAPIIVLNGDLVVSLDLRTMLEAHSRRAAALTVAVRPYVHQVPFGVIDLIDGRVVSLQEKPSVTWGVNAGVYAVSPSALGNIPPSVEFQMTDLIAGLISRGEMVLGHPIAGDWIDVGQVDELRRARGDL